MNAVEMRLSMQPYALTLVFTVLLICFAMYKELGSVSAKIHVQCNNMLKS